LTKTTLATKVPGASSPAAATTTSAEVTWRVSARGSARGRSTRSRTRCSRALRLGFRWTTVWITVTSPARVESLLAAPTRSAKHARRATIGTASASRPGTDRTSIIASAYPTPAVGVEGRLRVVADAAILSDERRHGTTSIRTHHARGVGDRAGDLGA